MKRKTLFLSLTFLFFLLLFHSPAQAAVKCPLTTDPPSPITLQSGALDKITYRFNMRNIKNEIVNYPFGGQLQIEFPGRDCGPYSFSGGAITNQSDVDKISQSGLSYTLNWNYTPIGIWSCNKLLNWDYNPHQVTVSYLINGDTKYICDIETYTISDAPNKCQVTADFIHDGVIPEGDIDDDTWKITVSSIKLDSKSPPYYNGIQIKIDEDIIAEPKIGSTDTTYEISIPSNYRTSEKPHGVTVFPAYIELFPERAMKVGEQICNTTYNVSPRGEIAPSPTPTPTPADICKPQSVCYPDKCAGDCKICPWCEGPTPIDIPELKPLCEQIDEQFKDACESCTNQGKIFSAIGCLPTDFGDLIRDYVFKWGIGIAGGIAFLYFLYGSFLILTSSGNPEIVAQGKHIITSSISGLLLIIFSVFLLRVIGVEIFTIPGFE